MQRNFRMLRIPVCSDVRHVKIGLPTLSVVAGMTHKDEEEEIHAVCKQNTVVK